MENPHKEELAEIRKWLEHGDLNRACEKFKIPHPTGSLMLRGKTATLKMAFIAELAKIALKNKKIVMASLRELKDFE